MFDISEGPAMVCKVWDKEVRETRHKIMAAARLVLSGIIIFILSSLFVQVSP